MHIWSNTNCHQHRSVRHFGLSFHSDEWRTLKSIRLLTDTLNDHHNCGGHQLNWSTTCTRWPHTKTHELTTFQTLAWTFHLSIRDCKNITSNEPAELSEASLVSIEWDYLYDLNGLREDQQTDDLHRTVQLDDPAEAVVKLGWQKRELKLFTIKKLPKPQWKVFLRVF